MGNVAAAVDLHALGSGAEDAINHVHPLLTHVPPAAPFAGRWLHMRRISMARTLVGLPALAQSAVPGGAPVVPCCAECTSWR